MDSGVTTQVASSGGSNQEPSCREKTIKTGREGKFIIGGGITVVCLLILVTAVHQIYFTSFSYHLTCIKPHSLKFNRFRPYQTTMVEVS